MLKGQILSEIGVKRSNFVNILIFLGFKCSKNFQMFSKFVFYGEELSKVGVKRSIIVKNWV